MAKSWYAEALDIKPYFDESFYVGFNVGGFELGLVPDVPTSGVGGVYTYWGVANIENAVERLLELGASRHEDVTDVGGDIKVAAVIDPFGNILGVIENPHFRVDGAT